MFSIWGMGVGVDFDLVCCSSLLLFSGMRGIESGRAGSELSGVYSELLISGCLH